MNDTKPAAPAPTLEDAIFSALIEGESMASIQQRLGLPSRNVIARLRDNPEEHLAAKLYGSHLILRIRRLIGNGHCDITAIADRLEVPRTLVADILQAVPKFRAMIQRRQMLSRIDPELLEAIEDDIRNKLDPVSMVYCYGVSFSDLKAIREYLDPPREPNAKQWARILRSPKMRQALTVVRQSIQDRWPCTEHDANRIRKRLWRKV